MSWALLRHPEGLPCDVFITHSWSEGLYEFIDKLLDSWPMGARAVWCCVFANPQALDIGDLISDPRTSPFAFALASAAHVLVVTNRSASIYSRVWCIYEAFLAVESGKLITLASAPIHSSLRRSFALGMAIASLCFAIGSSVNLAVTEDHFTIASILWTALIALSQLCARQLHLSAALNVIAAALLAAWLGVMAAKGNWPQFGVTSIVVVVFLLNEVDRTRAVCKKAQASQLKTGYAGPENAKASKESDKARILDDIAEHTIQVDLSINVVMDAGMSTPALRALVEHGVDVRSSGELRWSMAMLCWIAWLGSLVSVVVGYDIALSSVQRHGAVDDTCVRKAAPPLAVKAASSLCFTICLIAWLVKKRDAKAFMVSSIVKVSFLGLLVALITDLPSGCQGSAFGLWVRYPDVFFAVSLTNTLLTLTGRRVLITIPYIGPALLQIFGPGLGCLTILGQPARRRHRRKLSNGSAQSVRSDSSDLSGSHSSSSEDPISSVDV